LLAKSVTKVNAAEAEYIKEMMEAHENESSILRYKKRKMLNKKVRRAEIKTEYTEVKSELTEEFNIKLEDFDVNLECCVKKMKTEPSTMKEEPLTVLKEPLKMKKEHLTLKNEHLAMKEEPPTASNNEEQEDNEGFVFKGAKDYPVQPKTSTRQYTRKKSTSKFKFTPEEDRLIYEAIELYGDSLNFLTLAKKLGRDSKSVMNRVDKLKTGESRKIFRQYSLAEDIFIMEAVLKHLSGNSLESLSLHKDSEWVRIGKEIGRPRGTRQRWEFSLKPWLLQHFSGTLNLDIRRMLANYLAEHFEDINSVDWGQVSKKPKFAGHSQASLRNVFSYLFKLTKEKLKVDSGEVSLENVADFANEAYRENAARKPSENKLKRQEEVISFFETYIQKFNIEFRIANKI